MHPSIPLPKAYVALARVTADFLDKSKDDITYGDVEVFKQHVSHLLNQENLSPRQIKDQLGIKYSDFGMFIKKCLKLEIKGIKQAVINTCKQEGRYITDEKRRYWMDCQFKFDPAIEPMIEGFQILKANDFKLGLYGSSLHRDHMFSIADGWDIKVDPTIISHPANCSIITAIENTTKNRGSAITLDQLKYRIANWNTVEVEQLRLSKLEIVRQPKSLEHRMKIREAGIGIRCYTDGKVTLKQHKDLPCPIGFKPGMAPRKVK